MKKKRLAFAKKHLHWTADDWGKVLFSDESTFQQFVVRHKHVRRPVGKRFDKKYTSATMKHPPSQMIWGAMNKNGTAGLYFLTPGTTMNGSKYVDLLKIKLLLHMSVHNTSIFMHDGAPCHCSKIVKKFLRENNVVTLDWPGNSPDLNPIENLWSKMKDLVAEKQPSSGKALTETIKEVWVKKISREYCMSLIASMPRRLKAVVKVQGGHTKYWNLKLFYNFVYFVMFFLRFCLIQKSLVPLNDFSVFTNWCLRINCRWFDTFANDCSWNETATPLYRALKILPLPLLLHSSTAKFVYNHNRLPLPLQFDNYFTLTERVYSRNTRFSSNNQLIIPLFKTQKNSKINKIYWSWVVELHTWVLEKVFLFKV